MTGHAKKQKSNKERYTANWLGKHGQKKKFRKEWNMVRDVGKVGKNLGGRHQGRDFPSFALTGHQRGGEGRVIHKCFRKVPGAGRGKTCTGKKTKSVMQTSKNYRMRRDYCGPSGDR